MSWSEERRRRHREAMRRFALVDQAHRRCRQCGRKGGYGRTIYVERVSWKKCRYCGHEVKKRF